ncbi:MAG: hypothetical protein JW866_08675 [Ignavibacteriales bacterium]|nr:hypothetical protein [Ignavibacteriales bacterium]
MSDTGFQQQTKVLEKNIRRKGYFTLADASAITGISMQESRKALDELMTKYVCRLQVTEQGDLIYDFGKSPLRRGEKTFKEKWQDFTAWLWKAFKFLFKIWITLMLVVYFIIFVVIMIALVFASSQGSKSKKGPNLNFIGAIFRGFFIWNTFTPNTRYVTDRYGYSYREFEPLKSHMSDPSKNKKRFVSSIYDFVFGPPRVENQMTENYKEVAAYLRQNNGIITLSELKALAGWTNEEAEKFMADCIIRFNGTAQISNDGVLYAEFPEITRSINKEDDGKIIYYWNEYEPEYKVTGNTTSRNLGIIFMNIFNLAWSAFFAFGDLSELSYETGFDFGTGAAIGLGWVPLIYSLLFFLVPILRYFKILPLKKKRMINNIRKRIIRVIYDTKGKPTSADTIMQGANQTGQGEAPLSQGSVTKVMNELIQDWSGEMEVNPEGKIIYKFPRLEDELKEVVTLRQQQTGKDKIGDVILDTDT